MCLTQCPSNNWPGALDHLDIHLVDDGCKNLGKISEYLLLSQGLAYINLKFLSYTVQC